MLSNPSAAFAPLLKPLFTAKTVPSTLVTVLLDWDDPFKWPRQLRQWVRVLRKVVEGLDQEIKEVMEETMKGWKEGRIGAGITGGEAKTVDAPLGPGEWEDELGVPLSVVCLNAEKQERMEKEYGWQEGDFDLVLQWMRCVLLKRGSQCFPNKRHANICMNPDGASLIYTTSFDSNNVRTLIHSSLGIQSLLKRETVKHNIIDRDKILIPPNWDSWGKIRILREGFEIETVANAWSVEIQLPPETEFDPSATQRPITNGDKTLQQTGSSTLPSTSAEAQETTISLFTSSLPNPLANSKPFVPSTSTSDRVTVPDTQTFLAAQAQVLERYRQVDEHNERERQKRGPSESELLEQRMERKSAAAHALLEEVARHQQPYKINVGGIQVDAEEVTRRIREREADRDRESTRTPTRKGSAGGSGIATPDGGKVDNESLTNYFQGLLKKAKESSESQSQSHSPRGGSSLAGDR